MLKSNIDLTANEMFSRRGSLPIPLWKFMHNKFPWEQNIMTRVETDSDLSGFRFEGLLTGSREERDTKKMYIEMDSGDTCDCCGAYLKTIPWDRTYGLCRKCQKDMEENYGNRKEYPWAFDTEMRAERGVVSLRW